MRDWKTNVREKAKRSQPRVLGVAVIEMFLMQNDAIGIK
jgi:hypothetical protein